LKTRSTLDTTKLAHKHDLIIQIEVQGNCYWTNALWTKAPMCISCYYFYQSYHNDSIKIVWFLISTTKKVTARSFNRQNERRVRRALLASLRIGSTWRVSHVRSDEQSPRFRLSHAVQACALALALRPRPRPRPVVLVCHCPPIPNLLAHWPPNPWPQPLDTRGLDPYCEPNPIRINNILDPRMRQRHRAWGSRATSSQKPNPTSAHSSRQ
jgi:hypothetical protein